MESETFPVDKSIEVLDGTTISKDNGFWTAVLLIKGYNAKIQVKLYMWVWGKDRQTNQERWVRKQNFTIGAKSWPQIKEEIEKYLGNRYQMMPKKQWTPRGGSNSFPPKYGQGAQSSPQPPTQSFNEPDPESEQAEGF